MSGHVYCVWLWKQNLYICCDDKPKIWNFERTWQIVNTTHYQVPPIYEGVDKIKWALQCVGLYLNLTLNGAQ